MTSTNNVDSIVIDYQKPNILYAADDGYIVYKSTDGGNTWVSVHLPPWMGGGVSGRWLAIDPHVPSHIYLAGYGWVGESVDGGVTFSGLNLGMSNMDPQSLSVDNGVTTQNFYAGLIGVWQYSRAAPTPGGTMTVTVPAAPPPVPAGTPVTISTLVVDCYGLN